MQRLGEMLKTARAKASLSLADVELATKIRRHYVEALENERFDLLPGRVYIKGYLRSLAAYYGLDTNELLRLFDEVSPTPQKFSIIPEVRYVSSPRPINGVAVLSVLLILALVGLGFYVYQQYGSFLLAESRIPPQAASAKVAGSAVPAKATPRSALPSPTPVPTPSPTPSPTPVREIVIEARIVDRVWLQVTVDGAAVYQGILQAGDQREWRAKNKIVIRAGNAGGVEITFNGKKQGLMGSRGEVLEKEWTIPIAGIGAIN